MHERYTFMLDILFVILSFVSVKYIKYACLSVCLSLATYGTYLCNTPKLDILYVFIFFGALVYYTYEIFMKNEDFKISIVE